MFRFRDLTLPLVAAPMAGGPSTPELVLATASAGGLGFLAAGYLTPDALAAAIAAVQGATDAPFGVNLFVPADADPDAVAAPGSPTADALAAYAGELRPEAERLGVEVGTPKTDDDGWAAKLDVVERLRVPVVSFTFGLPPRAVVDRLHSWDACVVATVASAEDGERALALGVDALVVQGTEAGGHRATGAVADEPNDLGVLDLLGQVRAAAGPDVELVAAGGLATPDAVAAALAAGATAAQIGTALLRAPEAGTSAVHRAALADPRLTETTVTRAFTGRPARALANAFTARHTGVAAYPEVHFLTSPLRKAAAAAGDADGVHLWAGTGWREAAERPAAEILTELGQGVRDR